MRRNNLCCCISRIATMFVVVNAFKFNPQHSQSINQLAQDTLWKRCTLSLSVHCGTIPSRAAPPRCCWFGACSLLCPVGVFRVVVCYVLLILCVGYKVLNAINRGKRAECVGGVCTAQAVSPPFCVGIRWAVWPFRWLKNSMDSHI